MYGALMFGLVGFEIDHFPQLTELWNMILT